MASRRPIRFVFTGDTFSLNEAVSIEDFQWKEVAGTMGDIEYTLKLQKYVFYSAQRVVITPPNSSADAAALNQASPQRTDDRQQSKTYTLAAGDSLWKVAQSQLGSGARWREIQQLNNIKDADLKRLPIGKVLKLP